MIVSPFTRKTAGSRGRSPDAVRRVGRECDAWGTHDRGWRLL